jgi:hypothetical protein
MMAPEDFVNEEERLRHDREAAAAAEAEEVRPTLACDSSSAACCSCCGARAWPVLPACAVELQHCKLELAPILTAC